MRSKITPRDIRLKNRDSCIPDGAEHRACVGGGSVKETCGEVMSSMCVKEIGKRENGAREGEGVCVCISGDLLEYLASRTGLR